MLAGVDLGGTQVRVSVADDDGRIVGTAKTRTALVRTPEAMAAWVGREGRRMAGTRKVRAVAIGAPGPIDRSTGILANPPNLPGWRNVPLARLVGEALGCRAYLENDAQMAAWGEFHAGAGRGSRTMVYVTWSTGIGGGIIIDGRLFSGAHGSAGEIGHTIVDPDGPLDGCGQHGCLEVFAGGRQMQQQTGRTMAEIFEAAERGEAEALQTVERAATYVGVGLINLTNLFDPEVLVVGGGASRSWKLVGPMLSRTLKGSPFITPRRRPKLRRVRLGDRAGQVGAVEWARANA